jgi:hypothetical protein
MGATQTTQDLVVVLISHHIIGNPTKESCKEEKEKGSLFCSYRETAWWFCLIDFLVFYRSFLSE